MLAALTVMRKTCASFKKLFHWVQVRGGFNLRTEKKSRRTTERSRWGDLRRR